MCERDLNWFWFTSDFLKKWLKFLSPSLKQEMELKPHQMQFKKKTLYTFNLGRELIESEGHVPSS